MLPYPDPRMYAGGVPGYFDHLAGRPPPSAADFYAAAAVRSPFSFSSITLTICQHTQSLCQLSNSLTLQVHFGLSVHVLCPAAPHKQSA